MPGEQKTTNLDLQEISARRTAVGFSCQCRPCWPRERWRRPVELGLVGGSALVEGQASYSACPACLLEEGVVRPPFALSAASAVSPRAARVVRTCWVRPFFPRKKSERRVLWLYDRTTPRSQVSTPRPGRAREKLFVARKLEFCSCRAFFPARRTLRCDGVHPGLLARSLLAALDA